MSESEYQEMIKNAHRIVFKVGTSTLTHSTGKLNLNLIEKLVRQLSDLIYQGKEVLLVTSGAVGAGLGILGYDHHPRTLPEKQACAAVGQGVLVHIYQKIFSEYGSHVAQLLLTRDDLSDRNRFLNARNTLLNLLKNKIVPIINENDTVAVDEIKFGDNDTLSALVAGLVDADLLILLSDIDGLYTGDPHKDADVSLIETVEEIDESIESIAGGASNKFASGGMITKIEAAKIAVRAGIPMIITNGSKIENISRIFQGEKVGTFFVPPKDINTQTRKRWLAHSSNVKGQIWVDYGAFKAIKEKGKSLLPRGIVDVHGSFKLGDIVSIINHEGHEFARGRVNYDSLEVEKIKGVKCEDIITILGYQDYDEAIHRDNLAIR